MRLEKPIVMHRLLEVFDGIEFGNFGGGGISVMFWELKTIRHMPAIAQSTRSTACAPALPCVTIIASVLRQGQDKRRAFAPNWVRAPKI
jgi:hypothetical protein